MASFPTEPVRLQDYNIRFVSVDSKMNPVGVTTTNATEWVVPTTTLTTVTHEPQAYLKYEDLNITVKTTEYRPTGDLKGIDKLAERLTIGAIEYALPNHDEKVNIPSSPRRTPFLNIRALEEK